MTHDTGLSRRDLLRGGALLAAQASLSAQRQRPPNNRLDPGGRPGLCRSGMVWPENDSHSQHRPHGRRRHALHQHLFGLYGLRPIPQRPDDWLPCGTHHGAIEPGRRLDTADRRHCGASPEVRGLHDWGLYSHDVIAAKAREFIRSRNRRIRSTSIRARFPSRVRYRPATREHRSIHARLTPEWSRGWIAMRGESWLC
jgi:hypothetical protein